MKPNGRGRIFVSGVVFFLIVSFLARFLYDVHDLLHMAVTSSFCRAFLSVLIGWFGLIGLMIAVVVPFLGTRCIDPILREHFFGANGHLNELTYAACFLFRAPHGPNLLMICNNMLARDNNHQTTLAYVERIVDRIINKGRGMLTFNAGLIALSTALFKLSTGDGNPGSLAKQIGSASFASATAPSHPVMIALQTVDPD